MVDVDPPAMEEESKRTTPLRPSLQEELRVRSGGRLLAGAREALLDHLKGAGLSAAAREAERRLDDVDAAPRTFRVDSSSPFFEGPGELALPSPATDAKSSEQYRLTLQPKEAGKYPCNVVFRCPVETRVYSIRVEVTHSGPDKVLEFVAAARQAITQDIPVVNGTDKPWTMRAVLKGSNAFSGPPSFKVGWLVGCSTFVFCFLV